MIADEKVKILELIMDAGPWKTPVELMSGVLDAFPGRFEALFGEDVNTCIACGNSALRARGLNTITASSTPEGKCVNMWAGEKEDFPNWHEESQHPQIGKLTGVELVTPENTELQNDVENHYRNCQGGIATIDDDDRSDPDFDDVHSEELGKVNEADSETQEPDNQWGTLSGEKLRSMAKAVEALEKAPKKER